MTTKTILCKLLCTRVLSQYDAYTYPAFLGKDPQKTKITLYLVWVCFTVPALYDVIMCTDTKA